jgi:sporadic carbohydrate cluster 2OG-Fe(II) oxygenase
MSTYIDDFKRNGFTKISLDRDIISGIRNELHNSIRSRLDDAVGEESFNLNDFHTYNVEKLNSFRLDTIKEFNNFDDIKNRLFQCAKNEIEQIVGIDLAIQKNINLSFQLPNDNSSILPLHTDVWAGNSPFEIVLWIPFTDVSNTKSLYILPKDLSFKYYESKHIRDLTFKDIFDKERDNFVWPEVKFGEALIFSHSLLHGNVVNEEETTRISLNLRFKALNSPYGSKSLGDYFIPFKFSPASEIGWSLHGKW